jgi:CRP/FNR family transcriptional regulator, cyclic AMP receptor protein
VTHAGEIGFVASALVLAAFGMKDMVNLRIVAICSNFAFIAYALLLHLLPILVLHVVLLPLNTWRLVQALPRTDYNIGGTMVVKLLSVIRATVT